MIFATALLAALAAPAAPAAKLEVVNVRLTHGAPGPVRTDGSLRPGDRLVVSFDIEGLTFGPGGKVRYALGTEVSDAAGKSIHKSAPRELEAVYAFGGGRVPAFAQVDLGLAQAPGEYKLTVSLKDLASGQTQTLARPFTVLPAAFALVRLTASTDGAGQFPAAVVGPGQPLFLTFGLVGFKRNSGGKMQPDLRAELRILDEAGKPCVDEPLVGELKEDVPATALGASMQFLVAPNRPGKFTLELTATDRVGGAKATLSFPLVVVEPR